MWHRRLADKLRFRYPGAGGESYLDVISRLRPILIELERQRSSVLLVCSRRASLARRASRMLAATRAEAASLSMFWLRRAPRKRRRARVLQ